MMALEKYSFDYQDSVTLLINLSVAYDVMHIRMQNIIIAL